MDYQTNTDQFNQYVKMCGSKFAAINYVSKLARERSNSVHNCISEAQALTWILTGVEPDSVKLYQENIKKRKQRAKTYVIDRLSYIDDIVIRDAVIDTIKESKQQGHLIYCYKHVYDPHKQARVRVLSNIVWGELQMLETSDQI